MWSGPRNISTAMMRAFENRPGTLVCDEPLYAHYLKVTGVQHPAAQEIVQHGETDWRKVTSKLTGPIAPQFGVFYQKHMAHHLLPEMGREWLLGLQHAFLLRDPREMLLSLSKVTPNPSLADTGLPQQLELFEDVRRRTGSAPPVLDARDVLQDPRACLSALCNRVGIEFDPCMLSWPSGPRPTDGIWAPHWYESVNRSTGFEPWKAREGSLDPALERVRAECEPIYRALYSQRLQA